MDAATGAIGRAFVGIASVGFDSEANRIANEAPARLGSLVYAYGALRALLSWRPARFEVELDPPGDRRSFIAYTVGAANSKTYGGGMRAAPDALLDDGLLEVVVLENVSKLRFLTKHPAEGVQWRTRARTDRARVPRRAKSRSAPTVPSPCTPTATLWESCRCASARYPRPSRMLVPPSSRNSPFAIPLPCPWPHPA